MKAGYYRRSAGINCNPGFCFLQLINVYFVGVNGGSVDVRKRNDVNEYNDGSDDESDEVE